MSYRRLIRLSILSAVLVAREVRACSLIHMAQPFLWPKSAMMLATPTTDSVFAGPGDVKPSLEPGHNGPVLDRAIYGQVMRVDSALGPGARSSSRVVLVPWDYGPSCHPKPWGNSFLWRRLGAYGLYSAVLRDSAHWAAGLPTYDVFAPESEPYTDRPGGTEAAALSNDGPVPLTAVEMFGVARRFPIVTTEKEIEAATVSLFEWADANPQLVKRPPISNMLQFHGYFRRHLDEVDLKTRGTYRVTLSVGTDTAVFFARTNRFPTDFWDGMAELTRGSDIMKRVAAEGYRVDLWLAADTAGLGKPLGVTELNIAKEPVSSRGGTKTWKGTVWSGLVPRAVVKAEISNAVYGLPRNLEVTFIVGPDGSASFEHRSRHPDGRAVVIRAVRISSVVH